MAINIEVLNVQQKNKEIERMVKKVEDQCDLIYSIIFNKIQHHVFRTFSRQHRKMAGMKRKINTLMSEAGSVVSHRLSTPSNRGKKPGTFGGYAFPHASHSPT